MRTFLMLGFIPLFALPTALAACGDDPAKGSPSIAPTPDASPADASPDSSAPDAGIPGNDGGDAAPAPIHVNGHVVTTLGAPRAEASVLLIDARGRRSELRTDAAGAFAVDDVAAPYDLRIRDTFLQAARDSVFLGLTRATPTVTLFEGAKAPEWHQATITLSVAPPGCAAGCEVTARAAEATAAGSGSGQASQTTNGTAALSIAFDWFDTAVVKPVSIMVSVKPTAGNTTAAYAFAQVDTEVQSTITKDLGLVTPKAVATKAATVTVAAVPDGSAGSGALSLVTGGAHPFHIPVATLAVGANAVTVPQLAGATLDVNWGWTAGKAYWNDGFASFEGPREILSYAHAAIPLDAPAVDVAPVRDMEVVTPKEPDTLVLGGDAAIVFAKRDAAPARTLSFVGPKSGPSRHNLDVHLASVTALPLARIEALTGAFEAGEYYFEVFSSREQPTVDAFVGASAGTGDIVQFERARRNLTLKH